VFEVFSTRPASEIFEQCATQLGPARAAFTTQESVQDIEALRQAGGYEKLVLYGTSFGTKVALEYAERYPQNVEALVLDSVVPPEGQEPFAIPTFQAIAGVLDELCAGDACAGITANPVGDIATLAAQLRKRTLSGSVYDGAGRRHATTLDEQGLLDILEAGDLNPALRALLPAAVRSALEHDPDPLLRLRLLSEGLIPNVPIESNTGEPSQELDEALFAATSCEESPFPWQRGAPPATRLTEALDYLHAQPASDFYPFDPVTAYANSLVPDCAGWPDASPPPPAQSALPNVPTLILSGEQDMRTPTADARTVAARIPDAQLLVVPYTGHSVLGSDVSDCSALAVKSFFAGNSVAPCTTTSNPFAPTPVTPTRLSRVHPPAGFGGRPGRTLVAVLDTLVDLNRQVIAATLEADAELPSGSSFGGLHGGYAKLTATKAVLRDFSFVPGVELTATFPVRNGALQTTSIRISGTEASPGTVRVGADSVRATGTLAGRGFDVSLAKVTLSRAGAREWPSPATIDGLFGGRRAGARLGSPSSSWLP
jgi:pimeloyl-ACP methyl ester carboxylesterase